MENKETWRNLDLSSKHVTETLARFDREDEIERDQEVRRAMPAPRTPLKDQREAEDARLRAKGFRLHSRKRFAALREPFVIDPYAIESHTESIWHHEDGTLLLVKAFEDESTRSTQVFKAVQL